MIYSVPSYDSIQSITNKVKHGEITISVIGLGHVGLPLSVLFASEGGKVIGCDSNQELLRLLKEGTSPIAEHTSNLFPNSRILGELCPNCGVKLFAEQNNDSLIFCPHCMKIARVEAGRVRLSEEIFKREQSGNDSDDIGSLLREALEARTISFTESPRDASSKSDVIIITVGTPIDHLKRPDTKNLALASTEIGRGLKRGSLVILKSTVSPGTTENLVLPLLEQESHLKAGRDFGLVHMPETTLEGLALFELRTLPRIVGGIDRKSAEAAAAVFRIFEAPVYVFDSPKITESAKLFENIYRDVNIALANELALACEALGLDVIEVIEAARVDPKTHLLSPGPGVGGYCLPKDTFYLTEPASKKGFHPRITHMAREVNDSMPKHIVDLLSQGYMELGIDVQRSQILVLGLAFKANTADIRNSPSIPIIKALRDLGGAVSVHDPIVDLAKVDSLPGGVGRFNDLALAMRNCESIVLLTDHLEYRQLSTAGEILRLAPHLKLVVDARRIFDPAFFERAGIIYKGLGRGIGRKAGSTISIRDTNGGVV
jgi:UDP-N-acetyl-D-mannosaminuronic acid dehydrogenase